MKGLIGYLADKNARKAGHRSLDVDEAMKIGGNPPKSFDSLPLAVQAAISGGSKQNGR